jgi:hypothetical protein
MIFFSEYNSVLYTCEYTIILDARIVGSYDVGEHHILSIDHRWASADFFEYGYQLFEHEYECKQQYSRSTN